MDDLKLDEALGTHSKYQICLLSHECLKVLSEPTPSPFKGQNSLAEAALAAALRVLSERTLSRRSSSS